MSRTKQRERLMRCIIYSPHWLRTILLFVVKSAFYILTLAWGFRRCSFRLAGQCEGLYTVERVTVLAPRLFCVPFKMPFGCQMAKGLQHLCLKMCIWHLSLTSCRFSKRGEGIGNIVSILNFSVFFWLYIPKPNVGAGIYQNGVM